MKKIKPIQGQVSLWDLEITKTEEKRTKEPVWRTKTIVLDTKTYKTITPEQQAITDKYKAREDLSRIIHTRSKYLVIELINNKEYESIYYNEKGLEEFRHSKKALVLINDKILKFNGEFKANELQEKRLYNLKDKYPECIEIRRKGDENIILILKDKIVSINSLGWELEFFEYKAIYEDDEVVQEKELSKDDLEVGNVVEVRRGDEILKATIFTKYNNGNTYNIVWDGKHTAVSAKAILRKIS